MVRPHTGSAAQELLREGTVGFLLLALGFAVCAQAGMSSGLTCRITTDVLDSGGRRQAAGAVVMDASLGGFKGSGEVSFGVGHSGYAAQLFDPHALLASASPDSVPEGNTTQLIAIHLCDDGTYCRPDSAVAWDIVSGPVFAVDDSVRAYTDVVYEDTWAQVVAAADGLGGAAEFLVIDVDPDNFKLYAGDNIADRWQVRHFGVNNPNGLKGVDFDGDLQDNWFEFYAGTDPTRGDSRFEISMAGKPDESDFTPEELTNGFSVIEVDLTFFPAFTSRSYQAVRSTNLMSGTWNPLTNEWVFIGPEQGAFLDVAESNRFSAFALSIDYKWR